MLAHSPGDEVGEYVLEARLGTGAFGSVWKARHKLTRDLVVAIKLFPPETEGRRIVREAQALRSVQSPHVPQILGADPEADVPYIVMEFIPGESLREVLSHRGRLGEAEAIDLASQVLRGLGAVHAQGVLHRDIKPENLIARGALGQSGSRVVLVDFGLARVGGKGASDGSMQVSGGLRSAEGTAGTPVYMAPEVLAEAQATPASDLFSLALVLHESVTGRRPTAVRTLSFPIEGVSSPLSQWMRKGLSEEATARWKDVPSMSEGLRVLLAASGPPRQKSDGPAWLVGSPSEFSVGKSLLYMIGVPLLVGTVAVIGLVYWVRWDSAGLGHPPVSPAPSTSTPSAALDSRPADEQHKDAVDVNGTAELDYLPGPKAGGSQSTGLTAKDGRTIMAVYLSPGEGFGDSTWWVNAAAPGGGAAEVVGEFHIDREGVGATRTVTRSVVYDASVPGPRTVRQTFTSEVTAVDRDSFGTLKRIAVRVTVRTAR